MSGRITLPQAAAFAWAEADLLDRHDYLPWLALWTPGGRYVVPIDRDEGDPAGRLNIAYDDAALREARVRRLMSGLASSASPPARTVRTVSRFVMLEEAGTLVSVRAAQQIVEFKYGRTRVLAADVTYRLEAAETGPLLHEKTVRMINSDDMLHGIGYLF
jgi:3-phenylpropionate/cinnamic acid dioxygenase small subunit